MNRFHAFSDVNHLVWAVRMARALHQIFASVSIDSEIDPMKI